ncbi:tyrosine-type recombinase/integrase [Magnetofaba australis]|nr:tyrosine-type recombinase/integrase [Magnetofaba australis]
MKRLLDYSRSQCAGSPDSINTPISECISSTRFSALTIYTAIELLFETGVRVGELCSITLEDVDIAQGIITIFGKGSRERKVFMTSDTTWRLLTAYITLSKQFRRTDSSALLVTSQGHGAGPAHIRSKLAQQAKAAGLTRHITPHMLRHSAATHLIEAGVDIRFVQKLLGHQSIATTQIYTQVTDNSLRDVLTRAGARLRLEAAM